MKDAFGDLQNGTVYRSDLFQCRKLNISNLRIDLRFRHQAVWREAHGQDPCSSLKKSVAYHNWFALPERPVSDARAPFVLPEYLKMALSKSVMRNVARFRIRGHGLKCETGLYGRNPDRSARVCNLCENGNYIIIFKIRNTLFFHVSVPNIYGTSSSTYLIIFLKVVSEVLFFNITQKFTNLLMQLSIFLIDLFVGTYRLSSHARLEAFVIQTKLNYNASLQFSDPMTQCNSTTVKQDLHADMRLSSRSDDCWSSHIFFSRDWSSSTRIHV
jgi:hypothetical protein